MVKFVYSPRYYDYNNNTMIDGDRYASLGEAKAALERSGFVKCVGKNYTYYNSNTKVQAIIYHEED